MSKEYWHCVIGSVNSDEIPMDGDFPLRQAVQGVFAGMFPDNKYTCSSGWGIDKNKADQISFATHSDVVKKGIIKSYHDEGKKLPRHIRAWELLFEDEEKP